MHCSREEVDSAAPLHPVPCRLNRCQIILQTGRFAGNVYDRIHAEPQDLRHRLRMDPLTGRVQNDHIRLLFQFIDYFQDIAADEVTVRKVVPLSIADRSLHSLRHNLNTCHVLCHRRQDLGDRPGSAVEVEDDLILRISDVFPGCLIEDLRPPGIRLEK